MPKVKFNPTVSLISITSLSLLSLFFLLSQLDQKQELRSQAETPRDSAVVLGLKVPKQMETGKVYQVQVSMLNNGTSVWREGDYRLGSSNPRDNVLWGLSRVYLFDQPAVEPGKSYNFIFQVKAPSLPGAYVFEWRMLREFIHWFGQSSSYLKVRVIQARAKASPNCLRDKEIKAGKLYLNCKRVFLKTAIPLYNYATEYPVEIISRLKEKGYNAIRINTYWNHFDKDANGIVDQAIYLTNLNRFIKAVADAEMLPILSFETYNVGGGGVPVAFFQTFPKAQAINFQGELAVDTEYGTHQKIPSIFNPDYRRLSRSFIQNIVRNIDNTRILYYKTTVEPQYIGNQNLDYNGDAQREYLESGAFWPPNPNDQQWNEFRATSLAQWVSGDVMAVRELVPQALIGVDYLETGDSSMVNRNGNSLIFLKNLGDIDVLHVNWHWTSRGKFDLAYDNAWKLFPDKQWAITEHMTVQGNFDRYGFETEKVLLHSLNKGTRFGWDIVNTRPSTQNSFAVYNDNWSPKATIAPLDNRNDDWMALALEENPPE